MYVCMYACMQVILTHFKSLGTLLACGDTDKKPCSIERTVRIHHNHVYTTIYVIVYTTITKSGIRTAMVTQSSLLSLSQTNPQTVSFSGA